MDQPRNRLNHKTLWASILLGMAYSGFLHYHGSLLGTELGDGIIGVLLGLYICSHPAANLVSLLFLGRSNRSPFSTARSLVFWISLNLFVLVTGWIAIFVGTTRLVSRGN